MQARSAVVRSLTIISIVVLILYGAWMPPQEDLWSTKEKCNCYEKCNSVEFDAETERLTSPFGFPQKCVEEWNEEKRRYVWTKPSSCCGGHRAFKLPNSLHDTDNTTSIYNYTYYWGAPFGNAVAHYFNERAIAFLKGEYFHANPIKSGQTLAGPGACFPLEALPSQNEEFLHRDNIVSALEQEGLLQTVLQKRGYPHVSKFAAMWLLPNTVHSEFYAIAQAWGSLPHHAWDKPDNRTAVIHLRCEQRILKNQMHYGILPHRYYLENLYAGTTNVVIIQGFEDKDNACQWSRQDLIRRFRERADLEAVSFRSSKDFVSDWLYMSRASTLICSLSSFCLTAAWSNSKHVIFPVNQENGAVADPRSLLKSTFGEARNNSGFKIKHNIQWTPIDYLPGKVANNMSKDDILQYVRSPACIPNVNKCILPL